MTNGLIQPIRRKMIGALFCGPVLLACVQPMAASEQKGSQTAVEDPTPAPTPAQEIEMLQRIAVVPLTPDRAVGERHIGKRVRWAGSVHHMSRSDNGACLTILYALSGDYGEPRWTLDPTYQSFEACATGSYDPELVQDSTNVTIVGTVSGETYIGMGGGGSVGPVIKIEKLFRWSDCLAGDSSPVCKYGYLTPEASADDQ